MIATDGRYTYATGHKPLPNYTIKFGIGYGGFGEVYLATSDAGKQVAIKLVNRQFDIQRTELRGVRNCMNLKHPNLVEIYEIQQNSQGEYWVIMEFVNGESLAEVIYKNPNGMGEDEVEFWLHIFGTCCKK